ncbi:MAG TPA: peptidoglycan-binding domain-containing protein [Hyphomicrobiaceae bacterium]|nr:peptidoglycan-binding domain-containing protein [Hyphomicrobiaceae bacterium]
MRRRRSRIGAFGYGLMLAATATASLVGLHYLLAPPGPDAQQGVETAIATNVREIRASAVAWWSRLLASREQAVAAAQPTAAPILREQPAAAPVLTAQPHAPAPFPAAQQPVGVARANPEQELTRSIQHELKRVGCYAGSADGVWDDATRAAMLAFNDSVSVHVSVKGPERLLLTLLQGHDTRACTGAGTVVAGAAQKPAPELGPATAARQTTSSATTQATDTRVSSERSIGTWRTTVAVAPPGPFIPPPTQAVAAFASPAPLAPLPGRMAIGGPSTEVEPRVPTGSPSIASGPVAVQATEPAALPTATAAPRATRRERHATQRDRAPRPSRPAAPRQRDIFSSIARYSP